MSSPEARHDGVGPAARRPRRRRPGEHRWFRRTLRRAPDGGPEGRRLRTRLDRPVGRVGRCDVHRRDHDRRSPRGPRRRHRRPRAQLEIVVADGELFDRAQKYDGTARFTVPAVLDGEELDALRRAAHTLYDTFGCSGVARFDFFVTPDGIVLNEVNTSPGFTEQSQVPRMFAAVGLPDVELVEALLAATPSLRAGSGR